LPASGAASAPVSTAASALPPLEEAELEDDVAPDDELVLPLEELAPPPLLELDDVPPLPPLLELDDEPPLPPLLELDDEFSASESEPQ
jgi:hypothetical protein